MTDKTLISLRKKLFSKPKREKKKPTKSWLKAKRASTRKHKRIGRKILSKLI